MCTPRLPTVEWTDAPTGLNGLVCFAERRNLVSARMPSHFNWPLLQFSNIKVLDFSHLVYFKNTNLTQVFGDSFWLSSGKNGWGMPIHLGPTSTVNLNCWVRGKVLRLAAPLGPQVFHLALSAWKCFIFDFKISGLCTTPEKLNDVELMI
jgi:hypothetical protein